MRQESASIIRVFAREQLDDSNKPVTHPSFINDHTWITDIRLNFGTETMDVFLYKTGVVYVFCPPYFFQQGAVSEDLAFILFNQGEDQVVVFLDPGSAGDIAASVHVMGVPAHVAEKDGHSLFELRLDELFDPFPLAQDIFDLFGQELIFFLVIFSHDESP